MTTVGPQLVFETSRGRYGAPAEQVQRVVWLPVLTDTSAEGRGSIGTADLAGEEIRVLDLDVALGQRPEPYTVDHRLVVVETESGPVGIVATRVLDVRYLDDEDLVQPVAEGGLIRRTARIAEGLVELLDVDRLAHLPPSSREPDVPAEELFAPFSEDELEELARRQRRLAIEEPAPAARPERIAVLAEIDTDTIAIPLEEVEAFVRLGELTPVPHAPDHVLGLTNHRGEVVTIVDAADPLGLGHAGDPEPDLAVLVELPEGLAGIAIQEAGRTITYDDDELDPEVEGPGIRGEIPHGERRLRLVDPFALLRSDPVVVDQEAPPS